MNNDKINTKKVKHSQDQLQTQQMKLPQTLSNQLSQQERQRNEQKNKFVQEILKQKVNNINLNSQLFSLQDQTSGSQLLGKSNIQQPLQNNQNEQTIEKQQKQEQNNQQDYSNTMPPILSKSGSRKLIRSRSGTSLNTSRVSRSGYVRNDEKTNNLLSSIASIVEQEDIQTLHSQPLNTNISISNSLTNSPKERNNINSQQDIRNISQGSIRSQRFSYSRLIRNPTNSQLKQSRSAVFSSQNQIQQNNQFSMEQIQSELDNFETITQKSIGKKYYGSPVSKSQQKRQYSDQIKDTNTQNFFEIINNQQADWQDKFNSLKKISQICQTQQNNIQDFTQFFTGAQILIKDLRSALVQQAIETTECVFASYSNTKVLYKGQQFIIQLIIKAGNPSLQNFLIKQSDLALSAAVGNSICFNSCEGLSNNILTDNIILHFKPQQSIGTKIRFIYYISDIIILSQAGQKQTSNSMKQLLQDSLNAYQLKIDDQIGFVSLRSKNQFDQPCGIQNASNKLIKQIKKYQAQIQQIIEKYHGNSDPEIRKAIRKLYFVVKDTNIINLPNQYQKLDKIIQQEGVSKSWWSQIN